MRYTIPLLLFPLCSVVLAVPEGRSVSPLVPRFSVCVRYVDVPKSGSTEVVRFDLAEYIRTKGSVSAARAEVQTRMNQSDGDMRRGTELILKALSGC
jgi:hypothetical protein